MYEMGLPVCETGDPWHYDMQQRVWVGLVLCRMRLLGSSAGKRLSRVLSPCILVHPTRVYSHPFLK